MEADAIVADAETEFGRVDPLKPFHIAGASFGEAFDGLLNAAGDTLIRGKRCQRPKFRISPDEMPLLERPLTS